MGAFPGQQARNLYKYQRHKRQRPLGEFSSVNDMKGSEQQNDVGEGGWRMEGSCKRDLGNPGKNGNDIIELMFISLHVSAV